MRSSMPAKSLLLLLACWVCSLGYGLSQDPGFCRTEGRWILDGQGRVLILHGVNLADGCKDRSAGFLPRQTKEEILGLRKSGFNSVRYLIIWEAVEPEPGRYDEAYLNQVAERLAWCKEAGLRVILDMHQDLYSSKFSADGAPHWACLDDGIPFTVTPGGWFMNYSAPAVIRSFDNFWANAPGPGGVGIQDRYVAAWQRLAVRFKDDPNIIGYDVMNEPFFGSSVLGCYLSTFLAAKSELAQAGASLATMSSAPLGSEQFLKDAIMKLMETDRLFNVFDQASYPSKRFETLILQGFYDRLAQAIRKVDPHHAVVFEPVGGAAAGTRMITAIARPKDSQGQPEPNTIFSPHHYELSTDLGFVYDPAKRSVARGLARALAAGDQMPAPTWFGEWGAWTGAGPGTEAMVLDHLNAFDEALCGWAYWAYGKGFESLPFFPSLCRSYAEAIAGKPRSMTSAPESFTLDFEPSQGEGETLIWVPLSLEAQIVLEMSGASGGKAERDEAGRVHVIHPAGATGCVVRIALSPR